MLTVASEYATDCYYCVTCQLQLLSVAHFRKMSELNSRSINMSVVCSEL